MEDPVKSLCMSVSLSVHPSVCLSICQFIIFTLNSFFLFFCMIVDNWKNLWRTFFE